MQSSKMKAKDGSTIELVDSRISDGDIASWNAKQASLTFDTTPTAGSTNPVTSGGIKTALDLKANASDFTAHKGDTTVHITAAERTAWNAKQSALTFDTTPTAGSTNPVTSGGIKKALDLKANASDLSKHTGDTTVHITAAERTAWNAKQSALTFDTTPTEGSTNPVTSGGIKTALDLKANASDLSKHTGNTTVHITADERTAWNAKASTSVATTSANGLMSKNDKSKLDGISSGANKADVSYASKKLTKTINGTTTDVVAASTIISDTNTFGNFAAVTDVTVSNIKFHTYWQVAPTSSNQVYGFAVHPTTGKLYRVYNNKGAYSVYGYDTDTNTTYSFDGTYNSSTNKAATVSSITSRIATAKTELTAAIDSEASARESADTTLQTNIDTVDAKGIVINKIDGENVICFE